jgi:BirA family biotin operon repressor/biotin-[acetyl-CoA-carboxylase] ligase
MPIPEDVWRLDTARIGRRVHVYNQLDSTNALALSLGDDPANDGLALLARAQTAGRGQHGRSWQAPAGSSVLLSVLLFPPPPLRRPALMVAWAAVAVCETIRKLADTQAAIKWPNDVLIRGRKICGILIEQRTTGHADHPLATVVGIGLNVAQPQQYFDAAQLLAATSLLLASGRSFTSDEVARTLLQQLDGDYRRLVDGDFAMLESLWKDRLGLLGKPVHVEGIAQSHQGRLLDVTLDHLEVQAADGRLLRLAPESVRHLHVLTDEE